jgi:hypothetical protein
MVAQILLILKALFEAIPILNKWFSKTPTQKVDEGKEDVRKELEEFKETGRPKWD